MQHIYMYIGTGSIDGFCIFLRRQGFSAYVAVYGDALCLVTDYTIKGMEFVYLGVAE
jgi:hypothetical protein